jgi:uncharacterized membrane protein YiaA
VENTAARRPTTAFVGASWLAVLVGLVAFLVGLYNARMSLSEKGFYLAVLLFGLFAAVSLQKSVRDRDEGIAVTAVYLGLCWLGLVSAIVMLTVGLWNSGMAASEKGFYAMSFVLSLFAAITVQKNTRDLGGSAFEDGESAPAARTRRQENSALYPFSAG